MKVIKSLIGEELGGPVVEIRIELVDYALEAQHGEEARGEGQDGGQDKNAQLHEALLLLPVDSKRHPAARLRGAHLFREIRRVLFCCLHFAAMKNF